MAASGLSCSTWDLSLQRVGSLLRCGTCVSFSLIVACGLSCPVARGILVPGPGIELASPALQDGFLTTGPPGKSPTPLAFQRRNPGGLNIICSKDIGSALGKIFLKKDEIELHLSPPSSRHLSTPAEIHWDFFYVVGRNSVSQGSEAGFDRRQTCLAQGWNPLIRADGCREFTIYSC